MHSIKHSSIYKKIFLGILLFVVFLAPISLSLSSLTGIAGTPESGSISVTTNIAYAGVFADFWDVATKPLNVITNTLGNLLLSTASGFTWLTGELLNLSLEKTVFGMGSWINDGSLGGTIDIAWSLIRDICNLAFIFGFIYVGIRTILDPDHADTKRFVSRIIIGALLINFSLFFVKVIVDFANFTSFQIYTSLTNGGGNLSTTITQMLGLVTIYDVTSGDILQKLTDSNTGFWFFLFGTLVLIITAFVFLAAAILLIVRFVALILIMVFSPLLFAATVFPQTAHFASDLWGKLVSYAFFAPVYLLLTLVSLTLLGGLNLRGANFGALVKTGTAPAPGALDVILNFCIIIFFLIASLTIARRMGIQGGDYAVSKTKMLIGASTAGLAARAGRATVGRRAYEASQSEDLKNRASKGGVSGFVARRQLNTLRSLSNTSFDGRSVGGAGKAMGIGDGKSDGYAKGLEKKIKAEKEYAEGLGYDSGRVRTTTEAGKARMHQAEVLVKERKHAMEESTRPVREAIRDATRRSRDISLTEEERKVASADVQDLKTELDLLTSEHKEGIEHAQHEISEAKKLMEDSVKEIKGERIKNYADANEQLANTLSIAGHDFSPANRESAAVLRGEKDLKEMFGHIKGKVEHASHDAHAGDHGKKEAHGADAHAKKDDHADGHAH